MRSQNWGYVAKLPAAARLGQVLISRGLVWVGIGPDVQQGQQLGDLPHRNLLTPHTRLQHTSSYRMFPL